jgi:hypothetical protein
MIDKEICKKCIEKEYPHSGWTEYDEKRWKAGIISCSFDDLFDIKKVPIDCRYKLEQLLKEN